MIYFSDLDRTLIYSDKFINEETSQICIELLDGKEISYMSPKSIEILKKIMNKNRFIPATTRSIEQYKRIMFNQNNIDFEWAVVSNGGNILHNGEIFEPWNNVLEERLKQCRDLETVENYFKDNYLSLNGILKMREVDNIFFYIVVDREVFIDDLLNPFAAYLKEANWDLYINGRKIYFIPKAVTKEEAIKYLAEYLQEAEFESLGDSIMDSNMIKSSNKGYIPGNSYLANEGKYKEKAYISKNEGFKGIEEILCIIEKA